MSGCGLVLLVWLSPRRNRCRLVLLMVSKFMESRSNTSTFRSTGEGGLSKRRAGNVGSRSVSLELQSLHRRKTCHSRISLLLPIHLCRTILAYDPSWIRVGRFCVHTVGPLGICALSTMRIILQSPRSLISVDKKVVMVFMLSPAFDAMGFPPNLSVSMKK